MAQQTAVEWLIEQVQNKELEIVYTDVIHSVQIPIHIIEQAKQMEKEQLNIARLDGINLAHKGYGK